MVRMVEFDTEIMPDGSLRLPPEAVSELPRGGRVHVVVSAAIDHATAAQILRETAGSCQDDPSLVKIFEEIDRARHEELWQ